MRVSLRFSTPVACSLALGALLLWRSNPLRPARAEAAHAELLGQGDQTTERARPPSQQHVSLGVDTLLERHSEWIAGKKVGLVTHPAGVTRDLEPSVDRLFRDGRFALVQLWGPEHGIRGDAAAGDAVPDAVDAATKVPVESLYGGRRRPSSESLARVDVVLFDLQDIGARTYTYISSLGEVMHACAQAKKPLIVLDRPNPIGGLAFEGPVCMEAYRSFIGWSEMPVTHGMTMGEVARFYKNTLAIDVDLQIAPLEHWQRSQVWDDTRLLWTTTSPHIPRTVAASLYGTSGMVASTTGNVSDGVGTPAPFELIGASFIDGRVFQRALEGQASDLPGVRFQACSFKPFYGKFQGQFLGGVRLVLDDARAYRPVRTALVLLATLVRLYPEQLTYAEETVVAKHWGNTRVLELLRQGANAPAIEASWAQELERFSAARQAALLYP